MRKINSRILGAYLATQMFLVFLKLLGVGITWTQVFYVTTIPLCLLGVAVGVFMVITGKDDGNLND